MKRFCVNCNSLVDFDQSICPSCGKSALVVQPSKSDKTSGPTVNLSCAKCSAIRPFTQGPPTCTVCGWILGTPVQPAQAKSKSTEKADGCTGCLIGVLVILGFIGYASWYFFLQPEQDKLADEYHISKDNIIVEPKPHGCDFDDAPLGNKHCHYEKEVSAIRACEQPACRVTAVYVSWKKIEE